MEFNVFLLSIQKKPIAGTSMQKLISILVCNVTPMIAIDSNRVAIASFQLIVIGETFFKSCILNSHITKKPKNVDIDAA